MSKLAFKPGQADECWVESIPEVNEKFPFRYFLLFLRMLLNTLGLV